MRKITVLIVLSLLGMILVSGCVPCDTCDVTENFPPRAKLEASPTEGEAPLRVHFNASNSYDPDGNIVSYDWDYGNGDVDSGKTTSYTYNSAGSYTVTLTVTDNDNLNDSVSKTVSVGIANRPPRADADGPYSGLRNQSVTLNATNSDDPDGTISNYKWKMNGNQVYSGSSATYNLDLSGYDLGSHSVKLIVTDDEGAVDTDTTVLGMENLTPIADFNASLLSGEAPLRVHFNAFNSYDPDGNIVSYSWDYDNGNLDSGRTTTYTFNAAGTYYVELQVTDDDGATDTTTQRIEVESQPQPKSVSLSLNDGRNVDSGVPFPLYLDGWGNNGRIAVVYDSSEVTFISSTSVGGWNTSVNSSPGRVEIIIHDGPDGPHREAPVVNLEFNCNTSSELRFDRSFTEIYSGSQSVDVQLLTGATIE